MGNRVNRKEEEFNGFLSLCENIMTNVLVQRDSRTPRGAKKEKLKNGRDTFSQALTSYLEKELKEKIENKIEIKPPETKVGALLFEEVINHSNALIDNESCYELGKIYMDGILNNNFTFSKLCYDFIENSDNQEPQSAKNFKHVDFNIDKVLVMNEVNKANFSEEVFSIIFGQTKTFFHNAIVFFENIKFFLHQAMPEDTCLKIMPYSNQDLLFNVILTQILTSSSSYVKHVSHLDISFYVDVDSEIDTRKGEFNNNYAYNCLNLLILNYVLRKSKTIKKVNIAFFENHKHSKKFCFLENLIYKENFNNYFSENENLFKQLNKNLISLITFMLNSASNIVVISKQAQQGLTSVRYPSNVSLTFLKDKSGLSNIISFFNQTCEVDYLNKGIFYTMNIIDAKKGYDNAVDLVLNISRYKDSLLSFPKVNFINCFSLYLENFHFIVKKEADNYIFNFKNHVNQLISNSSNQNEAMQHLKDYSEHLIDLLKELILISKTSTLFTDTNLYDLLMDCKYSSVNFFGKLKMNTRLDFFLDDEQLPNDVEANNFNSRTLFLHNNTSNPVIDNFTPENQALIRNSFEFFSLYNTSSLSISSPIEELVGIPLNTIEASKLYLVFVSMGLKFFFKSKSIQEDNKTEIINTMNIIRSGFNMFLLMNFGFIEEVFPHVFSYYLDQNFGKEINELRNTLKLYIQDPGKYDTYIITTVNPKTHKIQAYFHISFSYNCKAIESLFTFISLFEGMIRSSKYKDAYPLESIKLEVVCQNKNPKINTVIPLIDLLIFDDKSQLKFAVFKEKNQQYLTYLIKSLLFHLSLHFPKSFERITINLNEIIAIESSFLSIIKDMKIKNVTVKDELMSNNLLVKYQKHNIVSYFPDSSKTILELTLNNSLLETLEFLHDNNISYDALKLQLKSISISSISQEKLEKYRSNENYLLGYRKKRKEMLILYFYMGLYEMFSKENSYFNNLMDFFKLFYDNIVINAKEDSIKFQDKLEIFGDEKFTSDCNPYLLYFILSKRLKDGKLSKAILLQVINFLAKRRVVKVDESFVLSTK